MRVFKEFLYSIFYILCLCGVFIISLKRVLKKVEIGESDVHSATFRNFFPMGGAGGGGAVLSCQKIIIGDACEGLKFSYGFYQYNRFANRKFRLWDLIGGAYFGVKQVLNNKAKLYVAHDYATALGYAFCRVKFVLISHIQGPRLMEKENFGEYVSFFESKIILIAERYVFKKAKQVRFPSHGSMKYFFGSKKTKVVKSEIVIGEPLYNTLYVQVEPVEIPNLKKEKTDLTFLSIGQLTMAKGMDRHIYFFELFLNKTQKRIHYIIVGDGPLKDKIICNLQKLSSKYSNFSYKHITKCSYAEIDHLQNISDSYLMLHRLSIFDLSTLEMMKKGKNIFLSAEGGNVEFSLEENIIFFEDNMENFVSDVLQSSDRSELNKKVYEEYFSPDIFKKRYMKLFKDLINS